MADIPVYKVLVQNPSSDATAAISGSITFKQAGPRNTTSGKLSGLPNPWTNTQNSRLVENNTGSVSYTGSPSSASDYDSLANEMLANLKSIVENKYGVSLSLIKEEEVEEEEVEEAEELVIEEDDDLDIEEDEIEDTDEMPEEGTYTTPSEPAGSEQQTPPEDPAEKFRIYTVFEKTIELDELSLTASDVKTHKIESAFSLEYPLIKINDYIISSAEITSMVIDSTEFLPKIILKCSFIHEKFSTVDMPKDGDIISVAIRSKSDTLRLLRNDYVITGAVSNSNPTMVKAPIIVTFFGTLFIPSVSSAKTNLSFEGTSFNAMKDLAQRLGLGFATNEDDTDDKQVWISGYSTAIEYINNTISRSWRDNESFYDIWIDIYYNLNFVNINKQLMSGEDAVDMGVWLNNVDKEGVYGETVNSENTQVTGKVLSNFEAYKATSNYITSWKPINNATNITFQVGTKMNCNMFEHNINLYDDSASQKYWNVPIEPTYDPEKVNKYILLRGRANQNPELRGEDQARVNYDYTEMYEKNPWMGIQYTITNPEEDNLQWNGNHHKNYLRAKIQNTINNKELDKLNVEVNVRGINLNLIRGDKTPIVLVKTDQIENQLIDDKNPGEDALDQFYSGWFLVKGFRIKYDHLNDDSTMSNFNHAFVLTRREWPPPFAVSEINDNENNN